MWRNRDQAFTKVGLYTADDHILANSNYLQIFVELPKLAPTPFSMHRITTICPTRNRDNTKRI